MKRTFASISEQISEYYVKTLAELIVVNQLDAEKMRAAYSGDAARQDLCDFIWSRRRDLLAALLESYRTGETPGMNPSGVNS